MMHLIEMGNVVPEMDLSVFGGDDQVGDAAIRHGILDEIVRRSALDLGEERPDHASVADNRNALPIVTLDESQKCRVDAFMKANPMIPVGPGKSGIIRIFAQAKQLGKLLDHLFQGQALSPAEVYFRKARHNLGCYSGCEADLMSGVASPLQGTGNQCIDRHVPHVFAYSASLCFPERVERHIGHSHQESVDVGLGLTVTDEEQRRFTPGWMLEELQNLLWC
jgi:hypothetical protein